MDGVELRATWLLDIDGVVNFFGRNSNNPWPDEATRVDVWANAAGVGMMYPIQFSSMLIDEILRIRDQYNVEVMLCSTWCGQAVDLLKALGLPPLPEAFKLEDQELFTADRMKYRAFCKLVEAGKRVVWTDDAAVPFGAKFLYDDALVIEPFEEQGLTPYHIEQIEAWLSDLG